MRLLLSNDDGINAPGLAVLAEACKDMAEVFVVAPDHERSGAGHGITVHLPIRAQRLQVADCQAWAVTGTPADCVKIAVEALLPGKPDLIIAGINRGANLGNDVLYSGTVSAAIEGIMLAIPSMAVSVAGENIDDYTPAAQYARNLMDLVWRKGLPPETIINVNVPNLPASSIAGVQVTSLGRRQYRNAVHLRQDPRGRDYYWLAGEVADIRAEEGTDIYAIQNGYISLTPIQFDLTNFAFLHEFTNWQWDGILTNTR